MSCFFSVSFVFLIFTVFIFCFVLFFCYQINIPIVRTPTSSRKPMPSVLNQILNQPSSRAGSPDVLAMAAAAAAVAQAKTELKKDVCIILFIRILLQAWNFERVYPRFPHYFFTFTFFLLLIQFFLREFTKCIRFFYGKKFY